MTLPWTCPHWTDLYVATVAGLCLGLLLGAVVTVVVVRRIDVRTLGQHSQGGRDAGKL